MVDRAHVPLSGFKRIVKHLHILSISTKIENGRMADEDKSFDLLAENVEQLSTVIASKSEKITQGLASLRASIEETLSKMVAGKESTQKRTQEILDNLVTGLSVLVEKRSSSSAAASKVAHHSEEVSASISEVVSSLQFHDITRQQIEHVADMFEQVVAEASHGDSDSTIREIMGDIGELQIDQLGHAKDELVSAIGRVVERLHHIASLLSGISEEVAHLTGFTDKEKLSFMSELNKSISSVVSSFHKNEETGRELAGAVSSVAAMIQELSAFVNDIEEIGSEIKLIALNAQIKAAQVSEGGGALGVLAEAIRTLAGSASDQTVTMTGTLTSVSTAATELAAIGDEDSRRDGEIGSIESNIKDLRGSLYRSHEDLASLLGELNGAAYGLTHDLEAAVEGITAHIRTNEVIGGVISGLGNLGACAQHADPSERGKTSKHLLALTSRYTMYQERQIHEAHVHKDEGETRQARELELGDNVELF
jgi:ABC-type transporter Mla subunit MlaD